MRTIQAYYGNGRGKTSAALGYVIQKAANGKTVIMIQFLKRKDDAIVEFTKRLEPEIRFFRFQKSESLYEDLTVNEQADEILNMKNGLNYAKKALQIGECDLLVLDEVLGLVDYDILSKEDLLELLESGDESVEVMMTGQKMPEWLMPHLDCAYELTAHIPEERACK